MSNTFIMPRIEDMPRITRQQLCDAFDGILERVEKEKIAFLIEDKRKNYVLCPASWVEVYNDEDFGEIVNAAVRYSIGRHTYMPGLVHDFVIRNIGALNDKTLSIIVSDIDREFKMHPALDYSETWLSLKSAIQEEISSKKRRIQTNEKTCKHSKNLEY